MDNLFVFYLKYYGVDCSIIEFARDIIKDALSLKHLNKICHTFRIICRISDVVEIGKQISLKKIWDYVKNDAREDRSDFNVAAQYF
jgi:hypothetical protein